MTRDEAIRYLQGIPEDEPVFVLRAQDKTAPHIVLMWSGCADLVGSPANKVRGAADLSLIMALWQSRNKDKVKVPD